MLFLIICLQIPEEGPSKPIAEFLIKMLMWSCLPFLFRRHELFSFPDSKLGGTALWAKLGTFWDFISSSREAVGKALHEPGLCPARTGCLVPSSSSPLCEGKGDISPSDSLVPGGSGAVGAARQARVGLYH